MAKNTYELIFEAVDSTSRSVKRIESSIDSLDRKTKNANSALSRLGTIGGKVGGALGKLAIAGTAAAGAFAFLATRNLQALDALGKTAGKLGVSTNFLSEYAEVAKEAGLEQTQFNVGLQRFLRRLGEAQKGTGTLLKPLKELGISVKDGNGNFKDGTAVFEEYIAKLGGVTNESAKLRLAFAAFDTEGVAFVNVANLGSEAIAKIRDEAIKAGLSLDKDLVQGAEKANDKIGNLIRRARGFGLQFFGAFGDSISTLADDITKALDEAVAGAGGMEAFAQRLAADFIRAGADLITGIASVMDRFINALNTTVNIMKQLVVAISKIPGSGFNATFDGSGITAQKDLLNKELEVLKERKKVLEAESSTGTGSDIIVPDFFSDAPLELDGGEKGSIQVGLLNKEIAELQEQLSILDNTIVFEKIEKDASDLAGAVEKTTSKLHEMAKNLDASADASAKEAEIRLKFPYDVNADAITRLTLAKKELNKVTGDGNDNAEDELETFLTTTRVLELATQGYIDVTNALTKQHNEQRINTAILKMANERYQEGIISISHLHDIMEKLGVTTNNYSDFTMDFNQRLRENTTLEYNRIKMLAEVNRRYEEGSLNATEYAVALRMLGQAAKDVDEGLQTFEQYKISMEESAAETDNLLKNQKEYLKVLEDQKKATNDLSEAQEQQLKTLQEKFGSEISPLAESIQKVFEDSIKGISGAMADMVLGLGNGFESLEDIALNAVRNIIAALIEAQIQKMILGNGMGGIGGIGSMFAGVGMSSMIPGIGIALGIGGLLGGLFADGGNVPSGRKPIVVGERGPELFLPGRSGQVVSNEQLNTMNGGGGDLSVTFNINAIDTQTGTEFIVENKRVITGVIQDAYRRRGAQGPLG